MLLGLDVGTGGTRAVVVRDDGQVVSSAAVQHAPIDSQQAGWAEQDPEDWWRATQQAIREVLATLPDSPEIESLALTGQMHGCVMLGADGSVLRPALIWCDQRTQAECDWLTESIGFERLIELVANPALPNFTLTKLLWVKRHQPELFARVRHVLCPKDYVRYRLTGELAMDVHEASGTLLLDVQNRRWSEEVAERAGIPAHWLPNLFESPEVCARIDARGATATGLAVGLFVVAGAGDQGAGAVGMGILTPGSVSATIGTSGVVFAATDQPVLDPLGRLHTFCHAAPGLWHVMGVTNGAGLSLRYFRDTFSSGMSYDELVAEASSVNAGSEGVLWAPYLFGERTPYLDAEARAAFVGVTATHTRAHFVRAVLEGVAMSLKDSLSIFMELGIPITSIRLGGGGARSKLWRQIQADVYGRPVQLLSAEEGGAFGAALLAGVGVGVWPTVQAACAKAVQVAETIEPVNAAAMEETYRHYRRVYPALREIRG